MVSPVKGRGTAVALAVFLYICVLSGQMLWEDHRGDEELSGSSADYCRGKNMGSTHLHTIKKPLTCISFTSSSTLPVCVSVRSCAVQVLLYDPLFDWTMNPLKAFYLQHDEQQELNATLGSTMGRDDMDNHRKSRCGTVDKKCERFGQRWKPISPSD